ncbi:MAG: hypothetical protein K2N15_09455 [Lachnospiraceae bacterium]|nr:hypothetical protein [Lachnospiraceae bacterium]
MELKKIKVQNDLGEECWYSANKFELIAEAVADLEQPTAAGAGQSAARSATPDGAQMIIEIDATAGLTTRQAVEEIGTSLAKGFMDGLGLHYGA